MPENQYSLIPSPVGPIKVATSANDSFWRAASIATESLTPTARRWSGDPSQNDRPEILFFYFVQRPEHNERT